MKGTPNYDALLSRSIRKGILACPECGHLLVASQVSRHLTCQGCKRKYSELELYSRPQVRPAINEPKIFGF